MPGLVLGLQVDWPSYSAKGSMPPLKRGPAGAGLGVRALAGDGEGPGRRRRPGRARRGRRSGPQELVLARPARRPGPRARRTTSRPAPTGSVVKPTTWPWLFRRTTTPSPGTSVPGSRQPSPETSMAVPVSPLGGAAGERRPGGGRRSRRDRPGGHRRGSPRPGSAGPRPGRSRARRFGGGRFGAREDLRCRRPPSLPRGRGIVRHPRRGYVGWMRCWTAWIRR